MTGRRTNRLRGAALGGGAAAAPLRLQVYRQLRAAIEQGSLAPGARLPPSRDLALTLGVARNTVLWAMDRLRAEGYVVARVGDGSYVAPDLTALRPAPRRHLAPTAALSRRGRLIAETALRWQPPVTPALPFRVGAPEVASFPFPIWDRLARQAGAAERRALAQYLDPAGLGALREAIAQWLWASRGVRCDAAQVLVCAGSQQALDLVGRLLLDPGDEVLVEDPGYPGIRACLIANGALVRPVAVDGEGFMLDAAAARWPQARLAVVTPSHQFPTGVRMSLKRRLALLDWSRHGGRWIVEDDYDGEFQYGAHRIPALTSLPHAERVLHVGTFSKTLHPGLRLGFVVLPHALLPAFASARALADRHAPGDTQLVLARFIAEGHLLRHLRRMRELYAQRQRALIDAVADASGGALQLAPSEHGMHLVHELGEPPRERASRSAPRATAAARHAARRYPSAAPPEAPESRRDLRLAEHALRCGVVLAPLSRYAIESPRRGLLFGYAGYDAASLQAAARRIAPLLREA